MGSRAKRPGLTSCLCPVVLSALGGYGAPCSDAAEAGRADESSTHDRPLPSQVPLIALGSLTGI